MKLSIPVIETIQKRHSVRTYDKRKLSIQDRELLIDFMKGLDNPFGVSVHTYIIDKTIDTGGEKLGTYGVIKGASTFLGVSIPDTRMAYLAVGYEFENLILYATSLNLATVWLAATFDRGRFASAMNIRQDEILVAISPVGYASAKSSIRESLMRFAMKSHFRKPWESLFFQADFQTPLTKEEANEYADALEMVRLAPSATNSQPWRVCKEGDAFHFYITYKHGSSKVETIIKHVDLGIALAHFHQTVLEQGLSGHFEIMSHTNKNVLANTYYIISWVYTSSKEEDGYHDSEI